LLLFPGCPIGLRRKVPANDHNGVASATLEPKKFHGSEASGVIGAFFTPSYGLVFENSTACVYVETSIGAPLLLASTGLP
jgi:hypothetical protein